MTEEETVLLLAKQGGDLKRHERRLRELEHRQADLEQLAGSLAAVAQRQTDMDADLKEIKKDVKLLAEKPGRRWDAVVEKAIIAVVGGLVGFVLMQLGLG